MPSTGLGRRSDKRYDLAVVAPRLAAAMYLTSPWCYHPVLPRNGRWCETSRLARRWPWRR